MKHLNLLKSKQSILRYLSIGLLAFITDYIIFITLYYYLDLNLAISTTAGYFIGLLVSFSINRLWVFGQRGRSRHPIRQIIEYLSLVVFNYFFTLLAIVKLQHEGVEPLVGKVIVVGVTVFWNYILFKKVIFADKKHAP